MTTTNSGMSPALKTILIAGFLTGLLDATAAMVQAGINDISPERVWKYVASGAIGSSAFTGGAGVVVLGLFCHFTIAFIFTVTFFFLYPFIRPFAPHIIITGILWGIVVWLTMHFVVTPLSSIPPRKPFDFVKALPQIGIHMFCVGLPMALVIHRYYLSRMKRAAIHPGVS
jgi:hypothetical protein